MKSSESRFNQRVKDYERKREAFNSEVQAYKAKVDKESRNLLLDDEKFAATLKKWLNTPADDFNDQWGYPDRIIKMPDGNRQYIYGVAATPAVTRIMLLETNPSGNIIKIKTGTEKTSGPLHQ
jgi:hypothetical protein